MRRYERDQQGSDMRHTSDRDTAARDSYSDFGRRSDVGDSVGMGGLLDGSGRRWTGGLGHGT